MAKEVEPKKAGRPPKEATLDELIIKEKESLVYLQQLARMGIVTKTRMLNRSREKERYIRALEKMR